MFVFEVWLNVSKPSKPENLTKSVDVAEPE